jgi:hypothetical protein
MTKTGARRDESSLSSGRATFGASRTNGLGPIQDPFQTYATRLEGA